MPTQATLLLDTDTASRESASERDAIAELRALYQAHCPLVWRALRRLGVSESSIEDAVQDVFLHAYRRYESFQRERSAVTSWLYGIALRVAQDYRRKRVRRERREARLAVEQPVIGSPMEDPADALVRREAHQLLHQLLDSLPDSQRELLVLIDLEGLDMREVALATGLNLRTCQRRVKAARLAIEAAAARQTAACNRQRTEP